MYNQSVQNTNKYKYDILKLTPRLEGQGID